MRKAWIKRGLMASGVTRVAGRLNGKGVAIAMYHSVMDEPQRQAYTLGGIIHSSAVFRRQMEIIAGDYDPVTLNDVLLFVRGEKELPAHAVAVTFDDGYADNYEVALPILERVGVPATFYVTVDCIETARLPWPSRLRYAFFTTNALSWNETDKTIWTLRNMDERDRAFLRACDVCAQLAGARLEQFVAKAEDELHAGPPESMERLMMSWDQVRALVQEGYIVGSHTMTHPNMAYIGDDEARTELADSKCRLEEALKTPVLHFSYPCPALSPHWSERTVEISKEVGYETAVTTDGGMVRKKDNPLCLRRIRPSKEVEGLRWNLECTFLGRAM
jgi:peptidoglycan/xylan/chitin deacetylase (PgdA/CDA1 family)